MREYDINSLRGLESAFVKAASMIRDELAATDAISEFGFTLEATGRTGTGDMKIEFQVRDGSSSWATNKVTANSIAAAVNELMRRHGFDKSHAPLCLPKYEQAVNDKVAEENSTAAASAILESEADSVLPVETPVEPVTDSASGELA